MNPASSKLSRFVTKNERHAAQVSIVTEPPFSRPAEFPNAEFLPSRPTTPRAGRSERTQPPPPVRYPNRLDHRAQRSPRLFEPARLRLVRGAGFASRSNLGGDLRPTKSHVGNSLRTIFRGIGRRFVAAKKAVTLGQRSGMEKQTRGLRA